MKNQTINELNSITSEEELIDLSAEEQQGILGGMCTYGSKEYSTGAKIDNGQVCRADGSWS